MRSIPYTDSGYVQLQASYQYTRLRRPSPLIIAINDRDSDSNHENVQIPAASISGHLPLPPTSWRLEKVEKQQTTLDACLFNYTLNSR